MIEVRYRKMFVGGLDTDLSESDMEQYFEQFGSLTSCTVHRNRETGRSRGFGFVTFKEASAVDAVQTSRPHVIKGCEVTTKRAVPRELFRAFDGLLTVTKIFVGGLCREVRDQDLRDYFSDFGSVTRADVMLDRETNEGRGFGFVQFDDYDPVDKAVLQGTHVIQGKDVTVRKAKSRLEMELIRREQPVYHPQPPSYSGRRRSYPVHYEEPRPYFHPAPNASFESFDFGPAFYPQPRRGRFSWE